MKVLFALLIAFGFIQGTIVNVDDLSQEAATAYANGDFQGAAKLYQQMIDEGTRNAQIYFNLGNAYYQLHDLGRSLLNYRRAEQLIPRDEDLQLNIARVRAQRIDPSLAYIGLGDQIAQWSSSWLSNSEAVELMFVLWWITCGSLSIYWLFSRWRKWARSGAIISCLILIFVGAVGGTRIIVENSSPSAIIVSENVSVLTGSDSQYMEIFELHAAGEVRIMERQNDWVRVQLPDLQEGWVKADAIEVI